MTADALATVRDDPFIAPNDNTLPKLIAKPTPNTWTFVTVLGLIDRFLRSLEAHAVVVADADLQYGPLVKWSFKFGQNPELIPNPYSNLDRPLERIVDLRHGDSTAELGVQVADLCAGLLTDAAVTSFAGNNHVEWGASRAAFVEMSDRFPTSFWHVSEATLRTLGPAFRGLTPAHTHGFWRW